VLVPENPSPGSLGSQELVAIFRIHSSLLVP
jgi:hypothetical protein